MEVTFIFLFERLFILLIEQYAARQNTGKIVTTIFNDSADIRAEVPVSILPSISPESPSTEKSNKLFCFVYF